MAEIRGKSIWLTLEGALLIVLGLFAVLAPFFAGLAVTIVVGWLLVMVGVLAFASAFVGGDHHHRGWRIASSVIALIAGILLVINPLIGASALTILIGAYLIFDGITRIGLALDHRKRGAGQWGWLLALGILDLILAAALLALGAVGSTILVGLVVGVNLIIAGVSLLMVHHGRSTSPASHPVDPSGVARAP
jgi:uncharacterized membrane protein HdeD (DUF308 family)